VTISRRFTNIRYLSFLFFLHLNSIKIFPETYELIKTILDDISKQQFFFSFFKITKFYMYQINHGKYMSLRARLKLLQSGDFCLLIIASSSDCSNDVNISHDCSKIIYSKTSFYLIWLSQRDSLTT
jgi:hypothetical protein